MLLEIDLPTPSTSFSYDVVQQALQDVLEILGENKHLIQSLRR